MLHAPRQRRSGLSLTLGRFTMRTPTEIDAFAFEGNAGSYPFHAVTGNQWDNALHRIGWREAHNAHVLMRLKEKGRGAAFGLFTLQDFARAIKGGYSIPAKNGAFARICCGGRFSVIYKDREFITLSGPPR